MSKTTKTILWIILAIIVIGLVWYAVSKKPETVTKEEETIKIGAILPLTGSGAFMGQQIRDGILLAKEHVNNNGGIKGRSLEVLLEDSKADAKEAVTAFNNLLMLHNPQAIITAFTAPTIALIPLAEENKMPLITTNTSAPGIAEQGEYIFKVFTDSNVDAPVVANYVMDHTSLRKFGVLYENDDYGKSYYEAFKRIIEAKDGQIVGVETFASTDGDFKTQLLKLNSLEVDGIYVIGLDSHYIKIFQQAKELGLKQVLMGNWILASPNVIQKMGDTLEGAYFTTPIYYVTTPGDKNELFNREYQQTFNKAPDAYAALGYDILMLVTEAIKIGGFEPEQIKDSLFDVHYDGLLGSLSFDEVGEINFPLYPATLENGKLKALE
jgi:branched-chain amino acid transport system substrate-binding protein